jgi:hypothetical protein
MNARIEAELALLRQHYQQVDYLAAHAMHWFRVHALKMPEGWSHTDIPAVFGVTEGHPGVQPYGFFVPKCLTKGGKPPSEHPAPHPPPFAIERRMAVPVLESGRLAGDGGPLHRLQPMGMGTDLRAPAAGRSLRR